MWPQKKPFDPLGFLRVGNVVQPAKTANTLQPQKQAPKPQQKPAPRQLPSQFSALNRPTVQNQVQRTVNPTQQQQVTAPFRQPAPQRIIAPAPVRPAMPQNTIKPALPVNQQVNQMTQHQIPKTSGLRHPKRRANVIAQFSVNLAKEWAESNLDTHLEIEK